MSKNILSLKQPFCYIRFFHLLLLCMPFLLSGQETSPTPFPFVVRDPYRWLENSADPRTQAWLTTQRQQFENYRQANPYREAFKQTLQTLLNYEAYSIPILCGDQYFFKTRLPGENQFVLYVQKGLEGTPRALIDPNQLSSSAPVSLSAFVPSPDGKHVAYGLAVSGSDMTIWHVMDVASGINAEDRLENIKFFPIVWSPDGLNLYYTRLDSDDVYRIYQHKLGTLQATDPLIYENANNPDFFATLSVSDDKNYLIIKRMQGSSGPNTMLYRRLDEPGTPFKTLLPLREGNCSYVSNTDEQFYFWTTQDAPMGKVITVDGASGQQMDLIAECEEPLEHVVSVGKYFVAGSTKDVNSRLAIYDRQGKHVRDIALPGHGTTAFADAAFLAYEQEEEMFLSFTNFVQPPSIYRYKFATNQLDLFKTPQLTFNPADFETQQVFYESKDGTSIPLFIVHKKGLTLDGNNDTLLYAYGGFGVTVHPTYSTLNMAWLEQGGVFALANIRGGSEYGKQWHEAGRRANKQNCFDDFIAAAEWLIGHHYTNSAKLAIRGASNGGLLTAVCVNQRPDLFGAALVEVGVLDMLRYHQFTVGRFWRVEYGNPDDPDEFDILLRYSPYHNIKRAITYPSILVVTGDHDDRVVPLHSYKYAAALQEALAGKGRSLLRVDMQAGHGAGKSISQWIDEVADTLSFVKCELNAASEKYK